MILSVHSKTRKPVPKIRLEILRVLELLHMRRKEVEAGFECQLYPARPFMISIVEAYPLPIRGIQFKALWRAMNLSEYQNFRKGRKEILRELRL